MSKRDSEAVPVELELYVGRDVLAQILMDNLEAIEQNRAEVFAGAPEEEVRLLDLQIELRKKALQWVEQQKEENIYGQLRGLKVSWTTIPDPENLSSLMPPAKGDGFVH